MKFLFIKLPLAFILLTVLWVVVLKWVPVWVTPLMIKRSIEYREDKDFKTQKKWKSLKDISPELVRAVIASEDNRFAEHDGFDRVEIRRAIDDHKKKGKRLRGASTISQQTAKNVFCYPSRTMVRKGFEAYFTFLIEKIWGKERIMEVLRKYPRNRKAASEELGISERTLYRKIKEYGIDLKKKKRCR